METSTPSAKSVLGGVSHRERIWSAVLGKSLGGVAACEAAGRTGQVLPDDEAVSLVQHMFEFPSEHHSRNFIERIVLTLPLDTLGWYRDSRVVYLLDVRDPPQTEHIISLAKVSSATWQRWTE